MKCVTCDRALPAEDLREVEPTLEADTANYQSLADARRLSVRWQRAYEELRLPFWVYSKV